MGRKRGGNYTGGMMTALLVLATFWVAALAFLTVIARRAPVGVEDENGFRVVEQPRTDRVVFFPALRIG